MFNSKSILITGGTGSFGIKFVHKILKDYKPKRLVIYSRDELKQFEMAEKYNQSCMRYFLGDVRDSKRLDMAMNDIDICVHAAAMKQVVASEYNPMEAIKTNVLGAENIISSCLKNNVDKVIALSTDKAASPINLYGATKLVSDKLFISANNITGNYKTKFSVVRYGNVVGSRGSVIPFYLDLLKSGKKTLPLTHKEMTRFVITLEQGVNFVIKSFGLMKGAEIFVPKIRSLKVTDLITSFGKGIKFNEIGIRPGEKMHELLFSKDESQNVISFKDFYLIKPSFDLNKKINHKSYKNNRGIAVDKDFEYTSNNKTNHLKVNEIRSLIKKLYK